MVLNYITITMTRSSIQCVTRTTTLQSNACVGTDCVVTSLCLQTIMIIDLAFIDV